MKTIPEYLNEAKKTVDAEIDQGITDIWKSFSNLQTILNMKEMKLDKDKHNKYKKDISELMRALDKFEAKYP